MLTSEGMPGWLPRAAMVVLGIAAAMYLAWGLVVRLRDLLVMLVVSLFLSFALEPAVNWLAQRRMRRGVATGLVVVTALLVLVAFIGLMGAAVVRQSAGFVDELPTYIEDSQNWVNDHFGTELDANRLIDDVTNRDQGLQKLATNLAGNAFDLTTRAVGVVFRLFTVGLFTFYMVAEGPKFRRAVLQFLPPDQQERVIHGWEIAIDKTGGYIYSRALLAAVSATCTFVFLAVVGVPFPLALALWVGVISQFVPTIGTYLAGALPVLVALLEDPVDAIIVLAFIILYQQVENYLLAPKITARTMDLHPAVAFGTVIAGASLLGGIGAVLALPAAAVLQAVGSAYVNRHEVIDTHMTRDHVGAGQGWFRRKAPNSSAEP